jgi:hypothetical protein
MVKPLRYEIFQITEAALPEMFNLIFSKLWVLKGQTFLGIFWPVFNVIPLIRHLPDVYKFSLGKYNYESYSYTFSRYLSHAPKLLLGFLSKCYT